MKQFIAVAIIVVGATRAHARTPADDVAKLVDAQIAAWSKGASGDNGPELYLKDATFAVTGGAVLDDVPADNIENVGATLVNAIWIDRSKLTNRVVTLARDGKSAWVSFELHMHIDRLEDGVTTVFERDYRASEIVASTAAGWKIAGGTWSQDRDNASVNAEAIGGSAKALAKLPAAAAGDQSLRDAFVAMIAAPLDATAAARKDLVVFGSGPGERTVGGAGFKRAWDAAWKGHLAIVGPYVAHLTPSGTTGWVIANVDLSKAAKKPYKIAFRLVCVFDHDDKGAWTLVHMHIAVAP